jgi:hypothetical protein
VDNNLEKIEHLLMLVDQREKLKTASDRKIAVFVNDTLLVAFRELLKLPDDAIVWDEFEIVGSMLAVKLTITYNPQESMTPFLQLVSTTNPTEPLIQVQRTMQIAIPMTTVFLPPEQIKMWLMKMAVDTFGPPPSTVASSPTSTPPPAAPSEVTPTGFDPKALTSDQVSQLLFFQQHTKGIKQ